MTMESEGLSLSANEEVVLLLGEKVDDRTALGLALKELVARGLLATVAAETRRHFRGTKRVLLLTAGPTRGPSGNAVLDAVLREFLGAGVPAPARTARRSRPRSRGGGAPPVPTPCSGPGGLWGRVPAPRGSSGSPTAPSSA